MGQIQGMAQFVDDCAEELPVAIPSFRSFLKIQCLAPEHGDTLARPGIHKAAVTAKVDQVEQLGPVLGKPLGKWAPRITNVADRVIKDDARRTDAVILDLAIGVKPE